MRFALRKNRDEDIGAGGLAAARGLDVQHGTLNHALEGGGGFRLDHRFRRQAIEIVVDEILEIFAQLVDIHAARLEDGHRIRIAAKRQQQMLKRRKFVPALGREAEGAVQAFFEVR